MLSFEMAHRKRLRDYLSALPYLCSSQTQLACAPLKKGSDAVIKILKHKLSDVRHRQASRQPRSKPLLLVLWQCPSQQAASRLRQAETLRAAAPLPVKSQAPAWQHLAPALCGSRRCSLC